MTWLRHRRGGKGGFFSFEYDADWLTTGVLRRRILRFKAAVPILVLPFGSSVVVPTRTGRVKFCVTAFAQYNASAGARCAPAPGETGHFQWTWKGETNMYKKTAALALLTAAACLGTSAQAKDLTGWFVNGGVGSAHYHARYDGLSGHESDTSFQINGGWRSRFIGVEAGYVDLGSVSESDGVGDSAKLSGDGWTLGLNGHFNPTDKWYISARAGFFQWTLDARASIADGLGGVDTVSGDDHGLNGYGGVGTGVDFNRHLSLGVNFDYYKIEKHGYDIGTRIYSVNLEYRF